jgi:hypothetical protein
MPPQNERYAVVRVSLPGPPPWNCVICIPENDAGSRASKRSQQQVGRRAQRVAQEIVMALAIVAPDQRMGLQVSPTEHWQKEPSDPESLE